MIMETSPRFPTYSIKQGFLHSQQVDLVVMVVVAILQLRLPHLQILYRSSSFTGVISKLWWFSRSDELARVFNRKIKSFAWLLYSSAGSSSYLSR